jgi:hypothetical protein
MNDKITLKILIELNNSIYFKDITAVFNLLKNDYKIPCEKVLNNIKKFDNFGINKVEIKLNSIEIKDLKSTINLIKICRLFKITIIIMTE